METIFLCYYSITIPTLLNLFITWSSNWPSSLTVFFTSPSFTPSSSPLDSHSTISFPSSLIFTLICGIGFNQKKTACSAHNHPLVIFLKERGNFFLHQTTHGPSIPSVSEHIFPSHAHIHGTRNKITIGKQKKDDKRQFDSCIKLLE